MQTPSQNLGKTFKVDYFLENSIEKSRRLSSLRLPAKATIYYMLSSALAKAVGILTTPIFTRILTGEEYGRYTFYMSWLGLCTTVCTSFISQAVIYRGLEKFKAEKDEFIFSSFVPGIGFSAIFCALLFAFRRLFDLNGDIVVLLTIQIFCDIIVGFCQTLRRYSYDYRGLSLTNAVSVISTPILAAILIFGAKAGYQGRIFALLLVSLMIASPHLSRILHIGKVKFNKEIAIYISKRSFPLLPHAASVAVGAEIDKLMITAMLGAEALAKYSVAHTLGLGLGFAVSALASALYPWVIRKLSAGKDETVEPIFSAIVSGLGASAMTVALLVPEIFMFLAPPEYADARLATIPLLLSTLPSFASSFITLAIVHSEHSGYTSVSAIAQVAASLLLNFILIPRLGFIGSALSLLISNLVTLFINFKFLKSVKLEGIISKIRLFKAMLLTSAISLASPLLYPAPALRIIMLILPATILLRTFAGIKELIWE